jgi:lipopolysaccharide/colanic/teichoic acid biosynthesis glycosyltransferase
MEDRWYRARDLAVAGPALVVLSPVLAVVGLAVRLDSRGPAFFRQERVGLEGRPFRIHKFRTMRVDHDGATVSGTGDPRVTRVGRFLRRTKLDELPQLIDVVRGDMSLVGPRPELAAYVALWPEADRRVILSVRPGVTDPASIRWRHESDELARVPDPERHYVETILPRKAEMYVAYVRSRSLVGDLRVLGETARVVASRGEG